MNSIKTEIFLNLNFEIELLFSKKIIFFRQSDASKFAATCTCHPGQIPPPPSYATANCQMLNVPASSLARVACGKQNFIFESVKLTAITSDPPS